MDTISYWILIATAAGSGCLAAYCLVRGLELLMPQP